MIEPSAISPAYTLSGLAVGLLVGLTGVGGWGAAGGGGGGR
jgi:hypothetical protein